MKRRIVTLVLLFLSIAGLAVAQEQAPLTNADVLEMMRTGLGKNTIVMLIQQGPCNFDTSPQALIQLKKAGASEEVISAMVAAPRPAAPAGAEAAAEAALLKDAALKAANAFGPQEKATKIRAIRWVGSVVENNDGGKTSFEEERVEVYPDRVYLSMRSAAGVTEKLVVSPDLSYESSHDMTSALVAATADAYRQQIRFDPPYVAQHLADYVLTNQGNDAGALKISLKGVGDVWNIDPQTGRLASVTFEAPSGAVTREYSDYRAVGDLTLPFKWRTTEGGRVTETTVSRYEVNPPIDEGLFQPPANMSAAAMSLRVLQTVTVPYTEDLGGDLSVNCQIMEAAAGGSPAAMRSLDSPVFADDATRSNLKMVCSSSGTSKLFPHEMNAMLVAGSDGKAYVIGCDKAWRWSRCYPLKTGEVFNASHTEKGLQIQGFNTRGGEDDATYSILMTKPLR
jgi:hypothetical protein